MSKFDEIYENFVWSLREKDNTPLDPSFKSNVLGLVNALINKKYIQKTNEQQPDPNQIEVIVAHALETGKINLDGLGGLVPGLRLHNPSLPPIILNIDKEHGFSVTIVNGDDPKNTLPKTFTGENIESIYADVIAAIKTIQYSPEAAVETLPPSTGANAQPEGETTPASALPGV